MAIQNRFDNINNEETTTDDDDDDDDNGIDADDGLLNYDIEEGDDDIFEDNPESLLHHTQPHLQFKHYHHASMSTASRIANDVSYLESSSRNHRNKHHQPITPDTSITSSSNSSSISSPTASTCPSCRPITTQQQQKQQQQSSAQPPSSWLPFLPDSNKFFSASKNNIRLATVSSAATPELRAVRFKNSSSNGTAAKTENKNYQLFISQKYPPSAPGTDMPASTCHFKVSVLSSSTKNVLMFNYCFMQLEQMLWGRFGFFLGWDSIVNSSIINKNLSIRFMTMTWKKKQM